MPTLSDKQLHDLARIGAVARLKELADEASAIRKMFPGLTKAQAPTPGSPAPAAKSKPRKRRSMSPEARKAVGKRMKAYWAKKRGEQAALEAAPEVAGTADGNTSATTTGVAPAQRKPAGKKTATKQAKKAKRAKQA